jgi:hypothetical protein
MEPGTNPPATIMAGIGTAPMLMAGFAVVAAGLAATFPLQVSFVAVFLFAAPHNWMEARYLLSRAPVKWFHRRSFLPISCLGVAILGSWFALGPVNGWWHTVLAVWILGLIHCSGRPTAAAIPLACVWSGFAWVAPALANLLVVYVHPLVALCFLYRQIARKTPEAVRAYCQVLCLTPLLALLVIAIRVGLPLYSSGILNSGVWGSHSAAINLVDLPVDLPGAPWLISLQVFLELLHYGVWILALPLLGLSCPPWRLDGIALVAHRDGWPRTVKTIFLIGAAAVLILWIGFAVNYEFTRRLYFTVAIVNVLAEVTMLAWCRSGSGRKTN